MNKELLFKGLEKLGYKVSEEKCEMHEKYSQMIV